MYREEYYDAMVKYLENEMYLPKEVIKKSRDCFTTEEWSRYTGLKITSQRLSAMEKKGMVRKVKDKHYYGDSLCRWWPIV